MLDALEQKGLATRTSGQPRRHIPASPDIAVEALVLRRHDELRRARAEIQRLQERAAASAGEQRQMIELVTTREAERHVFEQMQHAAQHELIFLERPPILIAGPEQPNETEMKALSRGVRYRSIADRAFLELPGVLTRVREDMQAGEEVRVVSKLPFKMVMADRSIALIPLNLERPGSPTMLVRSSALLDALYAMFELLWNKAAPITFTQAGALRTGEAGIAPAGRRRAAAAAARGRPQRQGDRARARHLGEHAEPAHRRADESVDARSRFQLGWLARALSGEF